MRLRRVRPRLRPLRARNTRRARVNARRACELRRTVHAQYTPADLGKITRCMLRGTAVNSPCRAKKARLTRRVEHVEPAQSITPRCAYRGRVMPCPLPSRHAPCLAGASYVSLRLGRRAIRQSTFRSARHTSVYVSVGASIRQPTFRLAAPSTDSTDPGGIAAFSASRAVSRSSAASASASRVTIVRIAPSATG